jgi:proteasome lid subunit RPN8/RPN11
MTTFILPRGILADIVDHAQQSAPDEVCGILAGCADVVLEHYPMVDFPMVNFPMVNSSLPGFADVGAAGKQAHFSMDALEHSAAVKAVRRAGHELLAVYHSHRHAPAYPSLEDVRRASAPGVVQVVVSLQNVHAPSVKGYLIEDGRATEVPLTVVSEMPDLRGPA